MVQYSLGYNRIFLFSRNKASDANIGIIAFLVYFEKTLLRYLQWVIELIIQTKCRYAENSQRIMIRFILSLFHMLHLYLLSVVYVSKNQHFNHKT